MIKGIVKRLFTIYYRPVRPVTFEYRGGYHDKCGVILSTVGMFSTVGDIMMHVGDIMSTMEGVQYCGGKIFCYLSTPQY